MKESMITGILAVCSVAMAILAGVGIFMSDRTAPVIRLEGKNNLTYTEGEPYDVLLENMSAEDDRDGDVTESLRVGSIYVTSQKRAMVVYVAKDEANNIGKLKREIRYVPLEKDGEEDQSGAEEEAQTEMEGEPQEPQDGTNDTTLPETPQEGQTGEGQNGNEPADGPVVTMVQNAATLKVGDPFNILRYVQSAVDRDGTSLSRSLHADGAYDMNQPGVYEIRVYATNGAGETSNIEIFTLTVEP